MAEDPQITQHFLVPQHIKLIDEEKNRLLQRLNISIKQLPMIKITDAAIKDLGVKIGDVMQIKRKSHTAKETDYYRVVVDG